MVRTKFSGISGIQLRVTNRQFGSKKKKPKQKASPIVHIACYEIVTVWCFKSFTRIFFLMSGLGKK